MIQIAACQDSYYDGGALYRHSVTDETKFARPGDKLPPNDEQPLRRGGMWEALAQDNLTKDGTVLTFIELTGAASGGILEFDAGFIAEVGMTINLRGEVGDPDMEKGGLYRINQVDMKVRKGDEAPHICVARIADTSSKRFIYEPRFV